MSRVIFIVPPLLLFSGLAQAHGFDNTDVAKPHNAENFYYKAPETEISFNSYEDQFASLIKSAITPSTEHIGSNTDSVKALREIATLFDSGGMLLKNVVYRSDTGYIRVTFASKDDRYVVKGTYGTSYDDVLVNSNYADKKKLIDLKIMYLPTKGGEYKYYHIFNTVKKTPDGDKMVGVETEPNGATCKYCHQLAKVSGEPSGLFFQRYQYKSKATPLHSSFLMNQMPGIFKDGNFVKLASKPDWLPQGFSDLSVRYNIPSFADIGESVANRNLILETPELLETLSMDNRASYCIAFALPGINTNGFDYVCTDYPKRMVYVQLNRQGDNKLIKYSHPFYKTDDHGEVSYTGRDEKTQVDK
jgi:hypothetical protein